MWELSRKLYQSCPSVTLTDSVSLTGQHNYVCLKVMLTVKSQIETEKTFGFSRNPWFSDHIVR